MKIVILGLSITSSWGNGHATTYRALVRELTARGHHVTFLERDVSWYASKRDLPDPPYCRTRLYGSLDSLQHTYRSEVGTADLVIVGSYVPEGVAVGEWVLTIAQGITAFYDIDTPVTLAKLTRGDFEYLRPGIIPMYDLYLSFTGGPALEILEHRWGAQCARALPCSVDPTLYFPVETAMKWDLGYLGTYSADRQPSLDQLFLEPARRWNQGRFVVAGPQYPEGIHWPPNTDRIEHLPPSTHRAFYNSQRFTLNVTRQDMVRLGYSPSVRLFEAAACGVPVISDSWPGLETYFEPGSEILITQSPDQTLSYLRDLSDERRRQIGQEARTRVLAGHTAAHRAATLEALVQEVTAVQKTA